MKINIAILLLTACFFASCKSSTSPTSTSNIPSTPNTMVVTVSGKTDTLIARAADTTIYGIKGTGVAGAGASGTTKSGFAAGFVLGNITSTGTYNVGTVASLSNPLAYVVIFYSYTDATGNLVKYSTPTTPGTSSVGTVTITTLTATNIQGTFNGTLTLQSGSGPQTDTIINGGVNATIY
jgi:hypothetical protein